MKYPKFCVPVRITLDDGSKIFCGLFVRQNQRVLDVLCDERSFLPVRIRDRTSLLNKARLLQIDLLTREEIVERKEILPEIDLDYLDRNAW